MRSQFGCCVENDVFLAQVQTLRTMRFIQPSWILAQAFDSNGAQPSIITIQPPSILYQEFQYTIITQKDDSNVSTAGDLRSGQNTDLTLSDLQTDCTSDGASGNASIYVGSINRYTERVCIHSVQLLTVSFVYLPVPPSVPFLDIKVVSNAAIYANFTAPLSDGGSSITGYKVRVT